MLRGVRERHAHLGRERVDRALALSQELQDFESVGARHRLADPGELAVEAVLEIAMRSTWSSNQ